MLQNVSFAESGGCGSMGMEKEESWTRKEDVRRGFGFWLVFFGW